MALVVLRLHCACITVGVLIGYTGSADRLLAEHTLSIGEGRSRKGRFVRDPPPAPPPHLVLALVYACVSAAGLRVLHTLPELWRC